MTDTIQGLRRRLAAYESEIARITANISIAIRAAQEHEAIAILEILDAQLRRYATVDPDPVKQAASAALYDVRNAILARGHVAPAEETTDEAEDATLELVET